jgi:hypothetical protein
MGAAVEPAEISEGAQAALSHFSQIPDVTLAGDLTRQQIEHLMSWCDYQAEDLWDGMNLQEILNVYRVSAVWENFEGWAEEEGDVARCAWNAVVRPINHLTLRDEPESSK